MLSLISQEQWQQEQQEKEASLKKKYQENLEQIGEGHQAAAEVFHMYTLQTPTITKGKLMPILVLPHSSKCSLQILLPPIKNWYDEGWLYSQAK